MLHYKKIFLLFVIVLLSVTSHTYAQQDREQGLRQQAIQHMSAGRYGEAIDLLNKFISANPRLAEGYNLRGLCFEKRGQFENAVTDFERAVKLMPNNNEYAQNLQRVRDIWYEQLRKKIQGHKREIAIDPTTPENYLEIGKSYAFMEEWELAEEWYDEYLERDQNASPDEIIRYVNILAKTEHIKKGEQILKIYVERYPDDWRLWSRYGYFTMWLGNNRTAEEAFLTALEFKPYFQEAQDGLDLARREGYVIQQEVPDSREYPIDRYYRLLRSNPDDIEMRFALVDELIKAERMEEAYDQLQILGIDAYDDPRYQEKWEYVINFRDETYRSRIDQALAKIEEDPTDKQAVKTAARYYEYLEEYDNAYYILTDYFDAVPEESDQELRYQYARIAAWSRDFDKAIEIIDDLLFEYPDNLEYQLFRSQLSVWNNRDLELAREYLTNILSKQPDNVDALISMGSLKIADREFDEAQVYADSAKALAPLNDEVIKLQSNIDFQRLRAEEEALYEILEEGRGYVLDGECESALPYYEDYLAQAEPNNLILKEYGDVQFCAEHYQEALDIYNEVLYDGYFYEAALQRGKVLYALGDSLQAAEAFEEIVLEDPEDFEANLYLGDSYAKLERYDSAEAIYDTLLTWELDSTQTKMVTLRKEFLPATGLGSIFESFPNYVGLAPNLTYYNDNLSFSYTNVGGRLEVGVTNYLSLGVSYAKTYVRGDEASLNEDVIDNIAFSGSRDFTTFKGHVFITFTQNLRMGVGVGVLNTQGAETQDNEVDLFVRYYKEDLVSISGTYIQSDGAIILYSPYLIDIRYEASNYRLSGWYKHKSGFYSEGYFQYVSISDENEGNDLQLRGGKYFTDYFLAGYEYFYSNFRFDADLYYSPINFESHSIFLRVDLEEDEIAEVKLLGKLGYVPNSDFLILQGGAEGTYKFSDDFSASAAVTLGSTSRDDTSYRFFSGQISAYWNIW